MKPNDAFERVKTLAKDYRQLWENWGLSVETLSESPTRFVWLITSQGFTRPVEVSLDIDGRNWWVQISSDEKTFTVHNSIQSVIPSPHAEEMIQTNLERYLPNYFERLSEYLVLDASRAGAIRETKIYLRRQGKALYLSVGGDIFYFQFSLRKTCWTWGAYKWINRYSYPYSGWQRIAAVKQSRHESPLSTLSELVKSLFILNI